MLTPINAWQPGRRYALDRTQETQWAPDLNDDEFWEIVVGVWEYTALSTPALFNLYKSLRYVFDNKIEGDIIECGVFFGGSVMFAAEVCKRYDYSSTRRIFALDTFWGFVRHDPETDIDIASGQLVNLVGNPDYGFEKEAVGNMESVGFPRLVIVAGDVLETIPTLDVDRIALLRLDTDTYDTTKFELEALDDKIPQGGVVIVDDYGFTHGCKKAVDDFIVNKPILLQRIDRQVRCWVKP